MAESEGPVSSNTEDPHGGEMLVEMARSKSPESRASLFERMTRLLADENVGVAEKERALAGDILTHLLGEVDKRLRWQLATRLSERPDAPVQLIRALATEEPDIATPVLEQSPVLNDKNLVEIIQGSVKGHLLAIARRRELSATVGQALIDHDDPEVIATLIGNESAELTEEMLAFLVEESKWQHLYQPPLVQRSDLPVALAIRLYTWVAGPLRAKLREQYQVDDSVIEEMLDSSVDSELEAWAMQRKKETKTQALVRSLHDRGELTLDKIVNALMNGETDYFREGLALLSGLPSTTVRTVMLNDDARGLAVIARTLDAPAGLFSRLYRLSKLDGQFHPSQVKQRDREAKDLYRSVDEIKARKTMRLWLTTDDVQQALEDGMDSQN